MVGEQPLVSRLRAVIAAKDEQVSVPQPRSKAAKRPGYWHSLATLARRSRLRSYLDTAAQGITALAAIRDALTRKALATATPRTRLALVPQQITWALPPVTWALPPVSHQPVRYHHPVAEPPGQPARWHIEPAIAGSPAHRAGWI